MTQFIHRMVLLVPADRAADAADAAAAVLPGGDHERAMFGVPVARSEAAAPEFLACSTLLTEDQRRALLDELRRRDVPSKWVRMPADDERRVAEVSGIALPTDQPCTFQDIASRALDDIKEVP